MIFASVARNAARSMEGKKKSRARARAAYDSALRFSGRVHLSQEESHSKLEVLKKRLEALGEKF